MKFKMAYLITDGYQMLENVMALYELHPFPIFTHSQDMAIYLGSQGINAIYYDELTKIDKTIAIISASESKFGKQESDYFKNIVFIGHGISEKDYYLREDSDQLNDQKPKVDPNLIFARFIKNQENKEKPIISGSILYAPTIDPLCSFRNPKFTIINDITELAKTRKVIIKPHAIHYHEEKYHELFTIENAIILPERKYDILSYMKDTDIFIGDVSTVSTMYTYFQRPFILLEIQVIKKDYSDQRLLRNSGACEVVNSGSILPLIDHLKYYENNYFETWFGLKEKLSNVEAVFDSIIAIIAANYITNKS